MIEYILSPLETALSLQFNTRLVETVLDGRRQALEPSAGRCQRGDDVSKTYKEDQDVRKSKLRLGIEASSGTLLVWHIGGLVRLRFGDADGRSW
jgi:hypothetical protein